MFDGRLTASSPSGGFLLLSRCALRFRPRAKDLLALAWLAVCFAVLAFASARFESSDLDRTFFPMMFCLTFPVGIMAAMVGLVIYLPFYYFVPPLQAEHISMCSCGSLWSVLVIGNGLSPYLVFSADNTTNLERKRREISSSHDQAKTGSGYPHTRPMKRAPHRDDLSTNGNGAVAEKTNLHNTTPEI